ncbi:MAG: hypothetical protein JWP64_448 [Pseudonocardia sp.]|jgi:hypothetical protein|uniref:PASTA domain-containing protein n=1 Tax=Pseudonocardia sp. TaxID=60912 RepID=UPI00260C1985|nr:PASTA domain-containing protein [Pseudonocardia sp.]MCU1625499.1 hypothetical protein [Pseudonocardia sp.]
MPLDKAPRTPTAPAAPAGSATPTRAAETAVAPEARWAMPDLVGANLQDAQNAIQSLTSFAIAVTSSHDRTGAGREQVVDRNWKVCDQSVPAGSDIDSSTSIDFGAVKLEESC